MATMAAGVALHLHLQGDAAGRRISGEAAQVLLLGLLLLLLELTNFQEFYSINLSAHCTSSFASECFQG
jgi:hypothetical protein